MAADVPGRGAVIAAIRERGFDECDADVVLEALTAQGLHVVTAVEKSVLDAMRDAEIESVGGRHRRVTRFMFELQEDSVCRAELARREVPE